MLALVALDGIAAGGAACALRKIKEIHTRTEKAIIFIFGIGILMGIFFQVKGLQVEGFSPFVGAVTAVFCAANMIAMEQMAKIP